MSRQGLHYGGVRFSVGKGFFLHGQNCLRSALGDDDGSWMMMAGDNGDDDGWIDGQVHPYGYRHRHRRKDDHHHRRRATTIVTRSSSQLSTPHPNPDFRSTSLSSLSSSA